MKLAKFTSGPFGRLVNISYCESLPPKRINFIQEFHFSYGFNKFQLSLIFLGRILFKNDIIFLTSRVIALRSHVNWLKITSVN